MLAHYRIVESIGVGGMGEVYLAHDTRLDRRVAIKLLPAAVSADPERRERFTREARAVAALTHPNIVTIHSVEESGDASFLTMEFVDGRTLADLLPAGGLPLDRLLKLAIPLADAVSAAHARGITHRDLKPANVMVTADGSVKVLDFGLAKLTQDLPPADATTTAATPGHLTGEGRIVGTVSYMSPEQAEGKEVDHRSDIFSLGVVLYEMATGERPFKGDTSLSTLSAILRDTPKPVTDTRASLPRDLAKIIRRALTKDRDQRFQSAKDLRNELAELKQELESGDLAAAAGAIPEVRHRQRVPVWLLAAGVLVIAAMGWMARSQLMSDDAAPPAIEATFTQLTSADGIETAPSLSPNGSWVVYASRGDIHLQSVGGQLPINLTRDEPAEDGHPAISPDGELVAFQSARAGGGIFVMGRTGESVRRLTDRGFYPAWTPDGTSVVFSTERADDPEARLAISAGWMVEVTTGRLTQIMAGDFMQPAVSPNGHRIAYWGLGVTGAPLQISSGNRDLWTVRLDGSDPVRATDHEATDWSPIWAPDGRFLYFASDRSGSMNLWRLPIDERTGRPEGQPESITTPSPWVGFIARSGDGRRLAYASYVFARNAGRVSFDPVRGIVEGAPTPITAGTLDWNRPEPSPDGEHLLLTSYHRQEDVYVSRADGSGRRQLTNDEARDRAARWSPDGQQIVFYSNRGDVFSLWTIHPDGSGARERVRIAEAPAPAANLLYPVWSPDGSRVLATDLIGRRCLIFVLRDALVTEPAETLPPHPDPLAAFTAWSWSPDGLSIAGHTASGVWVYSFETKAYTAIAPGAWPRWLSDSRRLVYVSGGRIFLADVATKQTREILAVEGETLGSPRLTKDDRYLYFTRAKPGADIWLATFK